jgi:hypothetical protein
MTKKEAMKVAAFIVGGIVLFALFGTFVIDPWMCSISAVACCC